MPKKKDINHGWNPCIWRGQIKARMSFDKNDQAYRAISTSKLHASRRFHTWPINVVVYHGS